MKIRSLMVSVHYPNQYYWWTPWNKYANLAISRLEGIEIEVIAPIPFSLPIKYLPYYKFSKIPLIEYLKEGSVHHPHFLYLLPKKLFYGFIGDFYRRSVSNYILKNIVKSDLVHSHQIYPDGYGVMNVCREWNVPLIVELHSTGTLRKWLNNNLIRNRIMQVFEFSSKIICISQELSELLIEIGIDSKKIEIIPLGVDVSKFKPDDKISLKKQLKIDANIKIILYVGRLDKLKGVNYLLRAIYELKTKYGNSESFKNLQAVIIGKGPELNNLQKLSEELDLQEIVTFKGELRAKKLEDWYSAADLFILPTTYPEGRPVVIYEAMASGCAVIATNVAGIPEQIKEGYNGILIKPENIDKLADEIQYLLENDDLMKKMGKNGRKRILDECWTWKGYSEKCLEIYKTVV
jgi:teichuronic acid biosynthesis glycosyltransferase TuaC